MAIHQVKSASGKRFQFAFDGSLAVPMYCLMWQDTDDVKPAASMPDQGTEGGNQTYFAARFAGIAMDARTTLDTNADNHFPVDCDVEVLIDCESDTFEVGDFVAADEQASGTALENLKVKKTSTEADSIGYVTRREGSAVTQVWARLLSRIAPHAPTA